LTNRAFKVGLIAIVPLLSCYGAQRGGVPSDAAAPIVMGILSRAHASASLEYWGRCDSTLPDFPVVRTPSGGASSAVDALREVFADDPNMEVTQEPGGKIRMVEADVPQDLLNVRISHISFKVNYEDTDALYVPRDALRAIMLAPEIETYMKAHDIGPPSDFESITGGRSEPSPKLPHISGNLDNVTLSEALDRVLQTFPGLWIYENCPSKKRTRAVFFMFFQDTPAWPLLEKRGKP